MTGSGVPTYLDTSTLLARLLRQPDAGPIYAFDDLAGALTSELTELECRRTLDRMRIEDGLMDEQIADRLAELGAALQILRIVGLSPSILSRAKAPFPTVVRSLDAIHLATAQLAGASVFLSLDRQQSTAARALGFQVP